MKKPKIPRLTNSYDRRAVKRARSDAIAGTFVFLAGCAVAFVVGSIFYGLYQQGILGYVVTGLVVVYTVYRVLLHRYLTKP